MKLLIKIGNVWERTLINHKRYQKDNNFHLGNINQNWECLGKTLINHLRYKKDHIIHLENLNKNRECLGKDTY